VDRFVLFHPENQTRQLPRLPRCLVCLNGSYGPVSVKKYLFIGNEADEGVVSSDFLGEKAQNDPQNFTQETKDQATRTLLKTGCELRGYGTQDRNYWVKNRERCLVCLNGSYGPVSVKKYLFIRSKIHSKVSIKSNILLALY
jgi:hypothetical protein